MLYEMCLYGTNKLKIDLSLLFIQETKKMIPNQISWCVVVLVQFILLLLKYAFEKDIDMWIVFIPAIISCVVFTYDRLFRCFYAEYAPPVQMSTNQEAVEFV